MVADFGTHAVGHAVEQVVFQAFLAAQSAEIAPMVETAGHAEHRIVPGDRPQIMRLDREIVITQFHAGRQTFAFQMGVVADHFLGPGAVQEEEEIRVDRLDERMQFFGQLQNGMTGEFRDVFLTPVIESEPFHFRHAGRADAGVVRTHAVKEKAVDRIIFRQFAHHVFQVFPIRRIVTGGPHFRRGSLLGHGVAVRCDPHPARIAQQFLIAEPAVEICADPDPFPVAGFGDLAQQIELQRRMTVAEFGVVIGISLVAAGMPGQEINPA